MLSLMRMLMLRLLSQKLQGILGACGKLSKSWNFKPAALIAALVQLNQACGMSTCARPGFVRGGWAVGRGCAARCGGVRLRTGAHMRRTAQAEHRRRNWDSSQRHTGRFGRRPGGATGTLPKGTSAPCIRAAAVDQHRCCNWDPSQRHTGKVGRRAANTAWCHQVSAHVCRGGAGGCVGTGVRLSEVVRWRVVG